MSLSLWGLRRPCTVSSYRSTEENARGFLLGLPLSGTATGTVDRRTNRTSPSLAETPVSNWFIKRKTSKYNRTSGRHVHGRAVTHFSSSTLQMVLFGDNKAADNCYHHNSWVLGFLRDVEETLCL